MNIEKSVCDRLGYKYKDIFSHLEFILNKMNDLLNNYGCGLSDNELEMLNNLILKLETGEIEIIEFTRPTEKYFDVDKIAKENKELKNGIYKILKLNEYMIHCESKKVIYKFLMKQWETIYETLGIPEPGLARCYKNNLESKGE